MKRQNLISTVVIILFSLLVIYLATQFRELPPILKRGLQPSYFPIGVAVLMIFLALLMFFKDRSVIDQAYQIKLSRTTIFTFSVIPIFVLLLHIDFILALVVSAFGINVLWQKKFSLLSFILLAVLLPTAIFLLFSEVLSVRFPRGLITNLIY